MKCCRFICLGVYANNEKCMYTNALGHMYMAAEDHICCLHIYVNGMVIESSLLSDFYVK